MSQRKRYLAKNTALFALNTIGTKLIHFLLVPMYTKAFTTSEYGVIDLVVTIGTILVPIITINIGEAVMRFALDEDANRNDIISIGIFYAILSSVLGLSAYAVVSFFPQITVSGTLVYLYCLSQGLYRTFACNLRGQEKLFHYALGNILNTFAAAALNILFLITLKLGINGYFYAYILANLISFAYCVAAGNVAATFKNFRIDKALMKRMVVYAVVLVPNSLMWWIMNSSDHIMVTAMIGIAANGIYAISYKIPSILSSLSTVFNQAWSYSAIHENKSSDRETFNNTMYDKLVRFQLIITSVLMLIMRPFLRIYVQPAYYEAWKYTPYLLVGYFFLTMGTFLSTIYTVQKDSRGFLFSGSVGAVMNICLNWLLIPVWGVHGAAFATCISYMTVFAYRIIDTRKYMAIHVLKPEYVLGYILLIITGISMAVPVPYGYILMSAEVALIMFINRHFVGECAQMIVSIINKVLKRRK